MLDSREQQALQRFGLTAKSCAQLHEGTGHQLYRLQTHTGLDVVLRLPKSESANGADSAFQFQIWQQVSAAGLALPLLDFETDTGICIYHFQQAEGEVSIPQQAHLLLSLQALTCPEWSWPYANLLREYQQHLFCSSEPQLKGWLRQAPTWLAQLNDDALPSVLCHHDLHRQNCLNTQRGILALDFEYASAGHPYVDLALAGVNDPYQSALCGEYQRQSKQPWLMESWLAAEKLALLLSYCWSVCQLQQDDKDVAQQQLMQKWSCAYAQRLDNLTKYHPGLNGQ